MDQVRHGSLATGVPVMDDDHWLIMGILAELAAAVSAEEPPARILAVTERLREATLDHFRAEERVMRTRGYPMATSHIAQHALFLQEVARACTPDAPLPTGTTVQHFVTWFHRHIALADRPFADWLLTQPA